MDYFDSDNDGLELLLNFPPDGPTHCIGHSLISSRKLRFATAFSEIAFTTEPESIGLHNFFH